MKNKNAYILTTVVIALFLLLAWVDGADAQYLTPTVAPPYGTVVPSPTTTPIILTLLPTRTARPTETPRYSQTPYPGPVETDPVPPYPGPGGVTSAGVISFSAKNVSTAILIVGITILLLLPGIHLIERYIKRR